MVSDNATASEAPRRDVPWAPGQRALVRSRDTGPDGTGWFEAEAREHQDGHVEGPVTDAHRCRIWYGDGSDLFVVDEDAETALLPGQCSQGRASTATKTPDRLAGERPDSLPEPPQGWGRWFRTYYGGWRSERPEDFAWVHVKTETLGPTVSAGYGDGPRAGEMARFIGHNPDSLRRACIAMGLRDWIARDERAHLTEPPGPPERPAWAPPCPEGWHDSPDHRGGWRIKGPRIPGTNHDYHLRLIDGAGGGSSTLHGANGDAHVFITSPADFRRACVAVGLDTWVAAIDKACAAVDEGLAEQILSEWMSGWAEGARALVFCDMSERWHECVGVLDEGEPRWLARGPDPDLDCHEWYINLCQPTAPVPRRPRED